MPIIINGHTSHLRIAEWASRYRGYFPWTRVGDNTVPITVADEDAQLVTQRWVYVIAETHDWRNEWEVIRELYIDKAAKTWVSSVSPYRPIAQRGEVVVHGGAAHAGYAIPRVNAKGHALSIRLLLSSFRLPSTMLAKLGRDFREQLHLHVAPLWKWERTDVTNRGASTFYTADGYSMVPTPLWMTMPADGPFADPGELRPVAAGTNIFALATNRSTVYIEKVNDYTKVYEPNEPKQRTEFERLMFARLLYDTVLGSAAAKEKHGKSLDIPRMNRAVKKDDDRKRVMIREFERAGAALCKVLASPLFELVQEASLSEECVVGDAESEALGEHVRVLGKCSRQLNVCSAGRAILQLWAEDSIKYPDHFANQVILPRGIPPKHYFKTFRSGSKAIASFLSEYLSHRVAVRQNWTKLAVTEEVLKPFAMLAEIGGESDWDWFNKAEFNPKTQITGIGVVGDVVQSSDIDLRYLSIELHNRDLEDVSKTVIFLDKKHMRFVEDWIDAGSIKDFGRNEKLLSAKVLGALVLDAVNVALALGALRDAMGKEAATRTFADLSAHSVNFAVAVAETYIKDLGLKPTQKLAAKQTLHAFRAVTSAYFCVVNASDALKSFRKGDNDHGFVMAIAATAEAASAASYFWMAASSGAAMGPWIGVAAGLIAAGAYIAASFLKDDPIKTLLENCEWGVQPYEAEGKPSWAGTDLQALRGDYIRQRQLLVKLLGRVSVSWASHGNAVVGLTIRLELFTDKSELRVVYRGEFPDRAAIQEELNFKGAALPRTIPGELRVGPSQTINDSVHPTTLVANVFFRLVPGDPEERVFFALIHNGIDQPDLTKSNVS